PSIRPALTTVLFSPAMTRAKALTPNPGLSAPSPSTWTRPVSDEVNVLPSPDRYTAAESSPVPRIWPCSSTSTFPRPSTRPYGKDTSFGPVTVASLSTSSSAERLPSTLPRFQIPTSTVAPPLTVTELMPLASSPSASVSVQITSPEPGEVSSHWAAAGPPPKVNMTAIVNKITNTLRKNCE